MHKQQAHSKKEGVVRVGYSNLTTVSLRARHVIRSSLLTQAAESVIAHDILIIRDN